MLEYIGYFFFSLNMYFTIIFVIVNVMYIIDFKIDYNKWLNSKVKRRGINDEENKLNEKQNTMDKRER